VQFEFTVTHESSLIGSDIVWKWSWLQITRINYLTISKALVYVYNFNQKWLVCCSMLIMCVGERNALSSYRACILIRAVAVQCMLSGGGEWIIGLFLFKQTITQFNEDNSQPTINHTAANNLLVADESQICTKCVCCERRSNDAAHTTPRSEIRRRAGNTRSGCAWHAVPPAFLLINSRTGFLLHLPHTRLDHKLHTLISNMEQTSRFKECYILFSLSCLCQV
jgi:hypothetical protein